MKDQLSRTKAVLTAALKEHAFDLVVIVTVVQLPGRHGASAVTPGLEQPALDVLYRTDHRWRVAACWLSCAGALIMLVSVEYRGYGVVLIVMSIGCQLMSWLAMRGAQRLEKQRLARLDGARRAQVAERWKGQS